MNAAKWTPEQDALLKAEYATANLNDLAERLGRPIRGLYKRATQLGIKRPQAAKRAADQYRLIALVMAARPEGVKSVDLGYPVIYGACSLMFRLVEAGLLFRAALGRRTVRYFTTQKAADRFLRANLASHLAKQALHKGKKPTRVGWDKDAPMIFTANTIYTIAPPPPAPTRTNTYSL